MYLIYINQKNEVKAIQPSFVDVEQSLFVFNFSEPFLLFSIYEHNRENAYFENVDIISKYWTAYETLIYQKFGRFLPNLDKSQFRTDNQIVING